MGGGALLITKQGQGCHKPLSESQKYIRQQCFKNIFQLFWHWQRCFVKGSRLNEQSQPSNGHHCQIIESDKTLAIFGLSTTLRSQNFNSCQLLLKMLLENRSGDYFSLLQFSLLQLLHIVFWPGPFPHPENSGWLLGFLLLVFFAHLFILAILNRISFG